MNQGEPELAEDVQVGVIELTGDFPGAPGKSRVNSMIQT